MDYKLAEGVFAAVLALLFLLYVKNKSRPPAKKPDENVRLEPDVISQAAGAIYRAHKMLGKIFAVVIVLVVLGDAVFDPVTRIIVLCVLGLMAAIILAARISARRK